MKLFKNLAFALVAGVAALSLASCSNVNKDYAEKINEAWEADANDSKYTYDKVMKDLGDGAIDATTSVLVIGRSGFIYAMKGCKTQEEMEAKIKSGEGYERLIVTIANGVATGASYEKVEPKAE